MQLPCDMNDADRLRVGETLTSEIKAREQVEAAKKAAVKDFTVALKAHRLKEHELNESLFTGKELREVEVEERPDYAAGIVFIHRLDTGDCVQQRAIDPDERQVKLGIDGPKVLDGGKPRDVADEQTAASPDEAEALRADRLAGERAERISAAVVEARGRITVLPVQDIAFGVGPELVPGFTATLQHGNRVLEESAASEEGALNLVVIRLTQILEAQEDEAATWADVAAASKAEQDRQEVERLAAEQAKDEATTPKKGFRKGLVAPTRKKKEKRITAALADGRVVDVEDEARALDGEPVTPGDDGPVATGSEEIKTDPETGLAF